MTNTPGSKTVLVDSDALIGLIKADDPLHRKCLDLAHFLETNTYEVISPFAIVLEAATTLARNTKIDRPDLARQLLEDQANTQYPDGFYWTAQSQTAASFSKNTSRKNTPFDHYLCALAKKNHVKYIFSFDSFYKKQGLVLAEELLKSKP